MRRGDAFGGVCLCVSVCLSVSVCSALTFGNLDLENLFQYSCTSLESLGQVRNQGHQVKVKVT